MTNTKSKNKNRVVRKSKIKISIDTTCKICNKFFKNNSGLACHLAQKHEGKPYDEYLLEFFNIDINKINEEYKVMVNKNKDEVKKNKCNHLITYVEKNVKGKSIKERMSDEKYDNFRKNMKGIFSLEWFENKYGKEDGFTKYTERNNNISNTSYFKILNKNNKNNWSKISQELFWKLYEQIKCKYSKIYFGELNHEYSCEVSRNNFDFVILDNKKVIEFNGDKFHANPKIYKEDDIPLNFIKLTAKEIWIKDNIKISKLINNNYELKIVWENDYLKNKEKIVDECIKFLMSSQIY